MRTTITVEFAKFANGFNAYSPVQTLLNRRCARALHQDKQACAFYALLL
jgi:hypothetical protein